MSKIDEIARAAEEADKQSEKIVAAAATATPAPTPAPTPAEPTAPQAATPADPAASAPASAQAAPVTETPATPGPTDEAPAPVPPQDDPNGDSWKHKYDTGEGIRKAQGKQIRELQAQLNALNERIAQMAEAPATPAQAEPAATPAIPAAGKKFTEDKFREEFGQVGDEIERTGQAALTAQERADQAIEMANRLSWERCQERLTAVVPDWQTIDATPEFRQWLATPDPMYGIPPQEALNAAVAAFDANRIATFFDRFAAAKAATGQVPAAPVKPAATRPRADVSPSSSRSSASPASPKGKVWTTSEVTAFYTNATKTRMQTTKPEEFARTEAEIDAARAEGRVVAG